MNILGFLFFVSVLQFLTFTCGLPHLGSCTFKDYTLKMRSCTTEFFKNMTSDPKGPCRPKFTALKYCAVKKLKPCVPSLSGKETIQDVVEQNFKEKTYCENAGIEFATLYPKVSSVPCDQAYYHEVPGCYNMTLKLWRENKSDKRLCCEYAKAKLCDKYLIAVHCIVFRAYREAKELVDLHYDDYNPFCVPSTLKTTNTVWSISHQRSFVTGLLPYSLVVIIGFHVLLC
ncbi:uncharacterized protein LOC116292854 [Actinia tenebrosa]|uniref:Uncharacterized protein LOC116292854 n=1 Tax=Actinia tenebrosa TaxID=6105 RepID=A0A6P8HTP6_ACTTE|nr:uncharacterized protein LOC116292854 [Actinia tenebrosa]